MRPRSCDKIASDVRGTHAQEDVPKIEMAVSTTRLHRQKLANTPRPGLEMRAPRRQLLRGYGRPRPAGILLSGNPNGPTWEHRWKSARWGQEGKVHPGDLLVKIGDVQAAELSFEEVLRMLKAASA